MAVTLDGRAYNIHQNKYVPSANRLYSDARGLTGYNLRTEAGVITQEYDLTLICTLADITALDTSYAKMDYTVSPPTNLLDFTDEAGKHWSPYVSGAGTLNTGVWFASPITVQPMAESGWQTQNRFLVHIRLIVNDNGTNFP